MARKKQRKKSWLRTLVFFLLLPLIVWFLALVIWFYWYDLRRLFTKNDAPPAAPKATRQVDKNERGDRPPTPKPQEKILDEERRKLEDVLKRRS